MRITFFWAILIAVCSATAWGTENFADPGPSRPATHLTQLETARTLPAGAGSLSFLARPVAGPIDVSREQVAFSDTGFGTRLGYGAAENLEARADLHLLTVQGSGHSGQFDAALAGKYEYLRRGDLHAAAMLSLGGEKRMSRAPWYFGAVRAPVTARWGAIELTLGPRVTRGFDAPSRWSAGAEAVARATVREWLDLVYEAFVNGRRSNPHFTTFLSEQGFGYLMGVAITPAARVSVPLMLLSRPPGQGAAFGMVSASIQVEL